ncbi:hypothetical protein RR46_03781 [Papilio xuthus]|uniref:FLYWCH-type domain-containing protein n=1 Tax=Papilio xuthus TaxID=66420 RepID=A0A194Q1I8_PAPXU|nr:hypothetical protein RR46_03781 [Papilio xuthus]
MHPLIREVHFHFPSYRYTKKGGKGKRTKLGLRDAHSSDETRNCFHFTPVFCMVVVFHRASRANSCRDVKAGSTTVDVQFIPTEKGKYILVLRGFTYSQVGGRFFYCSSKHMGCKARVRLMAGKLIPSGDEHNHAPPSHARCGNGAFVQLRPPNSPHPVLPSPVSSPRAALLALHALNFPRIMPKTDLWLRLPADAKKDP